MAPVMPHPHKHPKTGIFQLRRRVPADLVSVLGKKEVKQSLGTRDPVEAKRRFTKASAKLEQHWEYLRAKPGPIPHREIVGLAGEAYRDLDAKTQGEPGEPSLWQTLIGKFDGDTPTARLEDWYGPTADQLLSRHGRKADEHSRLRLIEEIHKAIMQGAAIAQRRAEGDYRPDPDADRFPDVAKPVSQTSFSALLTAWKKHGGNTNPATARDWERSLKALAEFLGHDHAHRVTRNDLQRWLDHMIESGTSRRTVRDKKLAAIRSVYRAALARQVVTEDPTDGIKVKVPKRTKKRELSFTDSEAKSILSASIRALTMASRASERMRLAYRWLPWLCAYTGARAGEIAQLRKEDVRHEGEIPYLLITPEAGTVKTGTYRVVPLHPHLVDQGFLRLVGSRPEGPLFYKPRKAKGSTLRRPWENVRDRVGEFARKYGKVTDPNVQPNHAWRHRFKSVAREADIHPDYQIAIQGHEDGTASRRYGEVSLKVLQREINRLPRYQVEEGQVPNPLPPVRSLRP